MHELKPGEKMGRITIELSGATLRCLVPGCGFEIHIPPASRTVMEHELKDYFRDHRSHRHHDYVGRTLFDFELAESWPRNGANGE